MIIDGKDFAIRYVDPTLPDLGSGNNVYDGLTPETGYRSIPITEDNICFIVRNTDTSVQFNAGTSKIKNICIIGMTDSSNFFYKFIPNEAKVAWGSDPVGKVNIKFDNSSTTSPDSEGWTNTSKHHAIFTALLYMRFENCRLMRTSTCGTNTTNGPGFMIVITNMINKCIFNNCEFGYDTIKIKDYYTDNSDMPTESRTRMSQYINLENCYNFIVSNCYIDAACVCSSTDGSGSGSTRFLTDFVGRGTIENLVVKNNTIYTLGNLVNSSYDTPSQFNSFVFEFSSVPNAVIDNNKIYFAYKNVQEHNHRAIFYVKSNDWGNITFINNKYSVIKFKDFTTTILNRKLAEYLVAGGSYYLNNNTFDYSDENLKILNCCALNISSTASSVPGLFNYQIKNLTVKTYIKEPELYTTEDNMIAVIIDNSSGNYSYNFYVNFDAGATTYLPRIIENIRIETLDDAFHGNFCNIISGNITGNVFLNTCCYANLIIRNLIPKLRSALNVANGNIVRLSNLIYEVSDDIKQQILINSSDTSGTINNNTILIDSAPTLPFYSGNTSIVDNNDRNSAFICYNYEDGKFFAKDDKSFAQSHAMTRTNSISTTMLKIANNRNAYTNNEYFKLSLYPLTKGFAKTISSGTYNLVFHFGAKNLTVDSLLTGLQINVYDDSRFTTEYTANSGILELDPDTTYNDVDVVAYKYTIPNITIQRDLLNNSVTTDLDVEIHYNCYSSTGYIYLDPIFDAVKLN